MSNADADRLLHCLRRGLRTAEAPGSVAKRRNQETIHPPDYEQTISAAACHAEKEPDEPSSERTPCRPERPESSAPRAGSAKPVENREIRPGVFYGSPLGKPAKAAPEIKRLLQRICHDLSLQEEARSKALWSTFARQEQAIEFVNGHGSNTELALFVYQDHLTGQRRFLATTYVEFWNRYSKMQANLRHHYEVIREDFPCHLYFDVEFNRAVNLEVDGESLVDLLLEAVAVALQNIYGLQYHPSWTLELDSSTQDKFSRHLILRIPQVAFKSNSHAGAFVGEVCAQMQSNERYEQLFIMEGDFRETLQRKLFVDQAVYSRNRSFRLAFSSKAGKTAVLLPTYRFNHDGLQEQTIFMRSLICNLDTDCKTLLTFGEEAARSGGRVPFCPSVSKPTNYGAFTISGMSPFPAVDSFIESYAHMGDVIGKIRSWYWFSEWGVLVYNISGNRFCERIGRQHKSNNIMYVVDFRTAGFYQKCHDPDCRGFKSPLRPIPREAIPPEFSLSRPAAFREQPKDDEFDEDSWWQKVAILDGNS